MLNSYISFEVCFSQNSISEFGGLDENPQAGEWSLTVTRVVSEYARFNDGRLSTVDLPYTNLAGRKIKSYKVTITVRAVGDHIIEKYLLPGATDLIEVNAASVTFPFTVTADVIGDEITFQLIPTEEVDDEGDSGRVTGGIPISRMCCSPADAPKDFFVLPAAWDHQITQYVNSRTPTIPAAVDFGLPDVIEVWAGGQRQSASYRNNTWGITQLSNGTMGVKWWLAHIERGDEAHDTHYQGHQSLQFKVNRNQDLM